MLSLTAKDIMTRDVITVHKGSSIDEALRLMACNNVSGLPVIEADNRLVGIITESDVLLKGQYTPPSKLSASAGIFAPQMEGVDEAYRRAQSTLVEEAMTQKVLTYMEDSLVVDIARAMIEHAINRVPIVRDGQLVGIVSRLDVVKALAEAVTNGDVCGDAGNGGNGRKGNNMFVL